MCKEATPSPPPVHHTSYPLSFLSPPPEPFPLTSSSMFSKIRRVPKNFQISILYLFDFDMNQLLLSEQFPHCRQNTKQTYLYQLKDTVSRDFFHKSILHKLVRRSLYTFLTCRNPPPPPWV